MSVPGIDQIHGVLIDNPSGSWLFLHPSNDFIAPYTFGFARSFAVGHTSLSVEFLSAGPAGQVSTLQGDPPIVILDSEAVIDSAGAGSAPGHSFVEGFTPVLSNTVSAAFSVSLGMIASPLFAAVPNKRYRVLTVTAVKDVSGLGPPSDPFYNPDSGVYYVVYTTSVVRIGEGHLTAFQQQDRIVYPLGLDCPMGEAIKCDAYADWANSSINITVSAQLI